MVATKGPLFSGGSSVHAPTVLSDLAANMNDFALPAGTVFVLNDGSDFSFSGFTGGESGRTITILHREGGNGSLGFLHETTSSAANQLWLGIAATSLTLQIGGVAQFIYLPKPTTLTGDFRWVLAHYVRGTFI